MGKTSLYIALHFFGVYVSYGQQQTYFVQFKDKNASGFSVDHPQNFLSSRALARREKCLVSVDEKDLPVVQSYIDQLVLAGAQCIYPLKWFNGVVVLSDVTVKNQLAALSFVSSVDVSVVFRKANTDATQSLVCETNMLSDFGSAFHQNDMLGNVQMNRDGYSGKGIRIAITDDGFLNVNSNAGFTSLFQNGQILSTHDLIDLDNSVYAQGGGHGAEVFSILAGTLTGQFSGPAVSAEFMLFRTEDVASESPLEELNWVRAAEIADSAGVDIIQVSLGYSTFDDASLNHTWSDLDGQTSYISKGASIAYAKGLIVVASAGNEGASPWRKILCPADVDGVLSVGAVDYDEQRTSFSSVGNSYDGRIKPDVMAMGAGVVYIGTDGILKSGGGTSFASPLMSGLVAGLLEAHPTLSHKEILFAIKQSSDRYTSPDSLYGYGIPNYAKASNYAKLLEDNESAYVYPNPFGADLNLKVPASDVGKLLDWNLYSAAGEKVATAQQVISTMAVSLWSDSSGLSSGVYFLKVSIEGTFQVFKVIK